MGYLADRLRGWEARLLASVQKHSALPMQWGVSDCLTFIQDCCEAVTGSAPFSDERGGYATALAARRRLRARGYSTVAEALAAAYGTTTVAEAQRGDIGLAADGAPTVLIDSHFLGRSEAGMVRLPRSAISRALKVR